MVRASLPYFVFSLVNTILEIWSTVSCANLALVHEPTGLGNVEPKLVQLLLLVDVEQHRLQVVLEHKHQLRLLNVLVATGNDNVESKLVHLLLLQLDVINLLRLLDVLVASGDEDEPDQLRLLEVVCDLHDVLPARDSDGNRNKL